MAGVIRREQFSTARTFSFQDIEDQAQAILRRAREEAARHLREKEEEAQRLTERGRQEGYARGLPEGRQAGLEQMRREAHETALREARERLKNLTDALVAGLNEFEQNKRHLLASAELGLIKLALAIAERVCKLHAAQSSAVAAANVRRMLELVRREHDLELHVHPEELETLREVAREFLQDAERLAHVAWVADPGVGRGGCIVSGRDGTVDATLDTQLQRVAETLCPGAAPGLTTAGAGA